MRITPPFGHRIEGGGREEQVVSDAVRAVTTQTAGLGLGALVGASAAKFAPNLLPPGYRTASSPVLAAAALGGTTLGLATMAGYYANRFSNQPTPSNGFWAGTCLGITLAALLTMRHLPLAGAALGAAAGGFWFGSKSPSPS